VLWKADQPLGALASFVDVQKKAFLFYLGARDESFNSPPPGFVLHAYSIRHAIRNGIKTYDFLRGNEPYKYSFAPQEYVIKCLDIGTNNGRNLGGKLDSRSVPLALERSVEFHKAGELVGAERGYRQVLDVEPRNQTALYCLGQLLALKGEHGPAIKTFKALLAINPDLVKARLWLGKSLQVSGRFADAAKAFRNIIRREPTSASAHRALGNVLIKLDKLEDAIAAYETALRLHPRDPKIEACLADARRASAARRPMSSSPFPIQAGSGETRPAVTP